MGQSESTTIKKHREPVEPRGPLFVDVCGIAMFLPAVNRLVVVDARKPRVAVTDGSMIAPHMPIVGIMSGTYEPPQPAAGDNRPIGKVTFDYDIDGTGKPVRFDAFVLDKHMIRFTGVKDQRPTIGGKKFGSMKLLAPHLELCSGIATGNAREVVGVADFSNAVSVNGKPHGKHDGPLRFGANIVDCADMAIATFDVGDEQPCIVMERTNEKEKEQIRIVLKGNGPWRVMIGNFPMEEIVGLPTTVPAHDVPLTHLELYYDLYHVGRHQPLIVPVGDNHIHANARTTNGRCGPTLVP